MESIRQTLEAIQKANLNINDSKGFEIRTKVIFWKSIDAQLVNILRLVKDEILLVMKTVVMVQVKVKNIVVL